MNVVHYENTRCRYCSGKFTSQQLRKATKHRTPPKFCSVSCRQRGHSLNTEGIPEPLTDKEEAYNNKLIERGKQEIQTDTQLLLAKYSPVDESPEAERKLRQEVCPRPRISDYGSMTSESKYLNVVKYTMSRPRSYRE